MYFCNMCKEVPETIGHMFCGCHIVSEHWQDPSNWIYEETNIEVPLNIILGLLE